MKIFDPTAVAEFLLADGEWRKVKSLTGEMMMLPPSLHNVGIFFAVLEDGSELAVRADAIVAFKPKSDSSLFVESLQPIQIAPDEVDMSSVPDTFSDGMPWRHKTTMAAPTR
jgi:hypothetical protein